VEARAHVFLLRGIGPATHRVMTMKALEAACHAGGLPGTRSIIATGNILIPSTLPVAEVEARFSACLVAGGLTVAEGIAATVAAVRGLPQLAEALEVRPARVQVHFPPTPVAEDRLDQLRAWAPDAQIARAGDEVVIDYAGRLTESALTVSRVDRVLGKAATARNWNTVLKILAAANPHLA
jgi:uncharacterized protein (DUF1697 family)